MGGTPRVLGGSELRKLDQEVAGLERSLNQMPSVTGVNTGIRNGFQSAAYGDDDEMWVSIELAEPSPVDTVVMVPVLARGSSGEVRGFGFPQRFILQGIDQNGKNVPLLDESRADFPNPGLYPVSATCPPGTILRSIRLSVIEPWNSTGTPVLAISEIFMLNGNRNMTAQAKVNSATSREIPPPPGANRTWWTWRPPRAAICAGRIGNHWLARAGGHLGQPADLSHCGPWKTVHA